MLKLNITDELELAGVWLVVILARQATVHTYAGSLSVTFTSLIGSDCQSQKANIAGRKPPVYIDEKIQDILASTMPLIIGFFIKIKSQFVRF
jgi:hypothetical protein